VLRGLGLGSAFALSFDAFVKSTAIQENECRLHRQQRPGAVWDGPRDPERVRYQEHSKAEVTLLSACVSNPPGTEKGDGHGWPLEEVDDLLHGKPLIV